jgi:hypothetical protein
MERYILVEVMAGSDDGVLWVTLGFSSTLEPDDVLHIVSGSQTLDRPPAAGDGLYLERCDQSLSRQDGAERVTVSRRSVQVELTEAAREDLGFADKHLVFDLESSLPGFPRALGIFQAMADQGQNVVVESAA